MKLATFSFGGRRSVGVVREDGIVDLGLGGAMEALLAEGAEGMARARGAAANGPAITLAEVELHAPVTRPTKFLAIAANYQSHIDEVLANNPAYVPPTSQRWFTKLPSCINGPYDPILMPPEGQELDYEAELAIVIGRRCRRVSERDAASVIAGFTVCNDVSVRDWQRRSPTIMLGKSFDTHGPLGPWLVTPDEVGDPHALRITCTVNGQTRQDGSTSEMIDNCYAQIAYLSTVCTLEPGDVIATGTPFGTGAAMKPPGLLQPGDVVRCEVERVGAIEATVQAETVAAQP
jgi:2-keto-4-pentenoate hydratase/2-oxohepta-3-ene-1,7-dioic acid hydratase in catechol pathway